MSRWTKIPTLQYLSMYDDNPMNTDCRTDTYHFHCLPTLRCGEEDENCINASALTWPFAARLRARHGMEGCNDELFGELGCWEELEYGTMTDNP